MPLIGLSIVYSFPNTSFLLYRQDSVLEFPPNKKKLNLLNKKRTARVVPLYKKSDKTDVGNYRSVSILTIISKIFESCL